MLMKSIDFKQMTKPEMKKTVGGSDTLETENPCYIAGTCGPNNEFTCSYDSSEQACVCQGKENAQCYAA